MLGSQEIEVGRTGMGDEVVPGVVESIEGTARIEGGGSFVGGASAAGAGAAGAAAVVDAAEVVVERVHEV